ncbi:sensor histidine kinase [Calothrix sp. 336/3]|uniref:sensor histidine kinase n=1 Tax=Calothrix sp. 336/3 TaxID=1337936 RepID=UPI0004E28F08|nr:ATP-binding protein [Calothrix sp. 336/3]AKG22349.1 hypothetical protein IJ00_14715 [Calothrix sp. 336/3]
MEMNSSELIADLSQSCWQDAEVRIDAQPFHPQMDDIYGDGEASLFFVVDVFGDREFRYLGIDTNHASWRSLNTEEVQNKTPEDIFAPIDAAQVRQHYLDCVSHGQTIVYEECLRLQGMLTWWQTTLTPLQDENSRIYRLIGSSVDITQSKQTSKAQLQQQIYLWQRSHKYTEHLSNIIEVLRDNLDVNQALSIVLQQLAQLFTGERCYIELYDRAMSQVAIAYEYSKISSPNPETPKTIGDFADIYQPLLQKKPLQLREVLRNWHPQVLIVNQLACPIFDAQGMIGNLWLVRNTQKEWDITEINLVQQVANQCAIALRKSEFMAIVKHQSQELGTLEHLKNEFLRTLSHELRTPITSISLAVQTLETVLRHQGVLEQDIVPQLLQILHTECHRESKLINDLLTLTYLEAEVEAVTLITIDIHTWLPPIVESFRQVADCQQLKLKLDISPGIPPLETDITDLERILTELLHNACKYTPSGGCISVSASATLETVKISVTNSGVEIPTVEQLRIFEPFYRIPQRDPWKYSGTGLGLALVKKLVKHLGAKIDVDSQADSTAFTLGLPTQLHNIMTR